MSGTDLRTEYERLARRIADAMADKPEVETAQSESWELLERLRTLTQEYAQKLIEAEAQIAELKRELFGPKADRLSPEQEDQMKDLSQDMEAESQRPAPPSHQVLDEEDAAHQK